jgi:ribosome biogenesis GTPase
VFADVEAIAAGCRFADCRHDGEPGCAVAEALADGRLAPERVAALEQLRREQAWADSRRDHRAQRERRDRARRGELALRRRLKEKRGERP